jgi:biopolymer transport protein ExbD
VDITKTVEDVKLELQIAPLIDVVFLLLIYFIMTAALIKKEGDISFMLPSTQPAPPSAEIPLEVLIEITAEGAVVLEGMRFSKDDNKLTDLVTQLRGLKDIAESQRSPFYVNILPNSDTEHQRVIDVMDACAAAKVKNLSFSQAM